VRREALKLMLRIPGQRADAILASLGDNDDANVRMGLTSALEGCPTAAVPRLMVLLNDRRNSSEIRSMAIRVLGTIRTPATRDWLVEHALTKQGWFRRRRLQPRTPELIAILGTLARGFRQDANSQLVLRLASESNDPELRRAASGAATEET
jgi:HEAT repeat protein